MTNFNNDYFKQFMSPAERTAALCSCGHDLDDEHRERDDSYVFCDECDCQFIRGEREAYEAKQPVTIESIQRDLDKAKRCIEDAMAIMKEIEKGRK